MGYASVLPFQILNVNFDNVSSDELALTNVAMDSGFATITTPDWKYTPNYAYMNMIVNYRKNTNVAENYVSAGNLALTVDDVVFQSCGNWKGTDMFTPASTVICTRYAVLGTTNMATYIKPNTSYNVYVQNARALLDGMVMRNISLELTMVFNV